jgi:phthiocerol/phenolphthiocerol synthesis type-I polyketide synthase B
MSPLEPLVELPNERSALNARRWSIAYLARLTGRQPAEIDLEKNVTACALDSMDAVVMASAMEEHFGVEIDAGLFLKDASLGDVLDGLCADDVWQEV